MHKFKKIFSDKKTESKFTAFYETGTYHAGQIMKDKRGRYFKMTTTGQWVRIKEDDPSIPKEQPETLEQFVENHHD